MRFSRDKRGYENTFVVQGDRRRGKGRPRLLYWFRTPPGVKVGRSALDEEAIRLIEELNPGIEFDWTRILKGEQPERVPERIDERRSQAPPRQQNQRPPSRPSRAEAREVIEETPAVEELNAEAPQPGEFLAPPPTAAHARLGGEGVSRLRGRYAEIMARISERVQDEGRREELKSKAERLNPDSWVTDDEVKAGLEEYEGVFESLRAVVGRRKRRRRRGGRAASDDWQGSVAGPEEASAEPEGPAGEPENDSEDH
jgi:hypothetical protein